MPRYFFHTRDGVCLTDEEGSALPNLEAAKAEAVRLLGETLQDDPETLWETGNFSVIVSDEHGLTYFHLDVVASLSPAGAALPAGRDRG